MERLVPENEPWVLDIVEAQSETTGEWSEAIVMGIAPGVDENNPSEIRTAYQLLRVDGSGYGSFPRERVRVLIPGGGEAWVRAAQEETGIVGRRWSPGQDLVEEREEDRLSTLRARMGTLHERAGPRVGDGPVKP